MNWKSFGRAFRRLGPISVLLAGLWMPAPVRAQSGSAAPSPQRKTSTPYTGNLSIFDAPGRDERLQINRVMDMLGIEPGKNVADIGAGSGWFTVRAARRVKELCEQGTAAIYEDVLQDLIERDARDTGRVLTHLTAYVSQ